MLPLSYNISYELRKDLEKIDSLRQEILLSLVPPAYELKLRWEVYIRRIRYAFLLNDVNLSSASIEHLLTKKTVTDSISQDEQNIVNYKNALDYLREGWIANPLAITPKVVYELSLIINGNSNRSASSFAKNEDQLNTLLDYLQARPDHPVVQAAIAYVKIIDISPLEKSNELLAQLLATMFLYKYGFELKGVLDLEEFFYKNLQTYRNTISEALEQSRLAKWIDYFASATSFQLSKIVPLLSPHSQKDKYSILVKLNDRQKEVLRMFDQPGATLTNRKMQKFFGISQITASRDLAKLAGLGLLFAHGKGRSVYYIKA